MDGNWLWGFSCDTFERKGIFTFLGLAEAMPWLNFHQEWSSELETSGQATRKRGEVAAGNLESGEGEGLWVHDANLTVYMS